MSERLAKILARDDAASTWFFAGSFVDEARKILYVATPKAACSSVKFMLRGLVTDGPLRFNSGHPESRLTMYIHDRPQFPLPALVSFAPERIDQITTEDGWFRFCVIRHPVERFFSAWRDKIFLCDPGYETYLPPGEARFVEFSDFLQRVVTTESPMTCEMHWRSQVALLRPDAIDYTHVYDLSTIGDLPVDLARHLSTVAPETEPPVFTHRNEGLRIASRGFLAADAIAALRAFYDADFRRFGFAELAPSDEPPARAADYANAFTDAIWDRNRIIATHVLAARQRNRPAD